MTAIQAELSPAHTAKGRLQRALLERLDVHERDGTLPTSHRFLFYELVQLGIVAKARPERTDGKKGRRADQDTIDALTHLREAGVIPWDWIVDETRSLEECRTAPNVLGYLSDTVQYASIDRWDGKPAPLILCESRSLAGALNDIAATYACPIASTNGQVRGFLVSKVAPKLEVGQRVLYVGDFDWCGQQIEAASRRTLIKHATLAGILLLRRPGLWERIALTEQQVRENNLPVISKLDRRYKNGGQYHDAVETEAFGQARIVAAVRARLNELMPEPIEDVLEREKQQREEMAEQLRRLRP